MIIAACVALIVGAIAFILLVRPSDLPPPEVDPPSRPWEERKARIYENLRDLQFEYRLGKLSDEDYQRTKSDLQKELAGVLAELDKLNPRPQARKATPQPKSGAPAKPSPAPGPEARS
jgi:hypothetical protein